MSALAITKIMASEHGSHLEAAIAKEVRIRFRKFFNQLVITAALPVGDLY